MLLLPAVLLTPLFAEQVVAQSGGWRTPVEVSQPPLAPGETPAPDERRYGSSWFADLALDNAGNALISWYSGVALGGEASNSLDLLMYRELRDDNWSPINEVQAPATGGFTVRNSVVAGRDGRLHAIYRGGTQLFYVSAPIDAAFSAQNWSPPRLLADGSTYYNALATDNAGGFHAFWSETVIDDPLTPNEVCANCSDLYYRRSLDSGVTWEPEINLSRSQEGENRPVVVVDEQNRIHITWDEGVDWYAGNGLPKYGVYLRSDDRGATWRAPARFSLPADAAAIVAADLVEQAAARAEPGSPASNEPLREFPAAVQQTALAVDGQGNPTVVFRSAYNERVYVQRSLDGGDNWQSPGVIPGVLARNIQDNNLDIYGLAFDGAGNLHLLMVGFIQALFDPNTPTNPTLLHLTFDGDEWTAPEPVVTNDLYPEYPRLQVYNGNELRAVWFTRSRDDLFNSERARYRVWYSERTLGAPVVAPLPLFTPIPTLQATATPMPAPPTPAPTALPADALAAAPLTDRPNWERSGLSTILLSLLPAITILGIVFAVRALIVRWRS